MIGLVMVAITGMTVSVTSANDTEIAQTIVDKLREQKELGNLRGFELDVKVEQGCVWMEGRVADAEQRALALEIARWVGGVKQVVNDIAIANDTAENQQQRPAKILTGVGNAMRNAIHKPHNGKASLRTVLARTSVLRTASSGDAATGSGVADARPSSRRQVPTVERAAQPTPPPRIAAQTPLAYGPARSLGPVAMLQHGAAGPGTPIPAYVPGTGGGVAPAHFDHPNMPGYAWPSYASHPNYAGLTYPKQYSATAWPYIGPFYPYPQVPLGWRKVSLEWDDGWWMLDFKAK